MSASICRYLCDAETFTGINPHDRYFLLFLAFNAEEDGSFSYPATKLIAMLGGVSRGSFYKQVSRLEKAGYLARQDGKLRLSARLVADGDGEVSPTATATVADGDMECRQGRLSSSPTPPLSLNKTINHEYSIDPPIVPPTQNTPAQKGDGEAEIKETTSRYTGLSRNSWEAAERQDATNVTVVPAQTWWERQCTRKPWSQVLEERRQAYLASQPKYTKEQEAFLDVYPKAPADPVAFVIAWEQAIKQDVLPRELIDAARIAANSPSFKKNEGQYVSKPENWIGSKKWAQIVEPWRAERKRRKQEREAKELERQLMKEEFDE